MDKKFLPETIDLTDHVFEGTFRLRKSIKVSGPGIHHKKVEGSMRYLKMVTVLFLGINLFSQKSFGQIRRDKLNTTKGYVASEVLLDGLIHFEVSAINMPLNFVI